MVRSIGCCTLLFALVSTLEAHAQSRAPLTLDLVKEAPKSSFVKPTLDVPKVQPKTIIADNVRAVAVLHAIWRCEKAGVFAAGDRIVQDAANQKVSGPEVKRLVAVYKTAPSASDRALHVKFVSELVHEQFDAIVDASTDQMKAYSELVGAVAAAVDQFMKDNVSENQERDSLESLGLGVSNAGYGATHYAASRISQQVSELMRLLGEPSLQKAYGAKDTWDLIAKLAGRSRATVAEELAIAQSGTELLLWLRHASDPKLKARAKKDSVAALAERLKKLGVFGTLPPKPSVKVPKPRPLCLLPGSPKPQPCSTLASKP